MVWLLFLWLCTRRYYRAKTRNVIARVGKLSRDGLGEEIGGGGGRITKGTREFTWNKTLKRLFR